MLKQLRYCLLVVCTCLWTLQGIPALQQGLDIMMPGSGLWSGDVMPGMAIAQGQSPAMLHRQGQRDYDAGQFGSAVALWQQAIAGFSGQGETRAQALTEGHLAIAYQELGQWPNALAALERGEVLAQVLQDDFVWAQLAMAWGEYQLHSGSTTEALDWWKQAEQYYLALADELGQLQSQLNQAQALQSLGRYRQALQLLTALEQRLADLPASGTQAQGYQSLGVTLNAIGHWDLAEVALNQSLAIAQQLQLPNLQSASLLQLGNLQKAQGQVEQAIELYQQSSDLSQDSSNRLTAQLNRFGLLTQLGDTQTWQAELPKLQAQLNQTAPSRAAIYGRVNLAESWLITDPNPSELRSISNLLRQAITQARQLQDVRGEAYALGELGHVYEYNQQWSDALQLTQQAVALAQGIQAQDVAMPWQWQQGRILKAQGNPKAAIVAYANAVESLQELRQDLVALSPDVQFSFREQVEPVYRQFVQLLLADVDGLPGEEKEARLVRSREVLEGLQLATLDNFFRQACVVGELRAIDEIDPKAAVIYPIVSEGRLDVVLSLPGQAMQHYGQDLDPAQVEQVFTDIQATLTPLYEPDDILPAAQQLYDWLLAPAEAALTQQSIETLVFVPDGFLRNIPMAVLHDGQQFVVEKYNTVLSPGLQLLPLTATDNDDLRVLSSGLSERRQGFTALPNVATEIEQVQDLLPGRDLLNQQFTQPNFEQVINESEFSTVHFATHGQFSSNVDDTFLLTWDDRISVQDLGDLLAEQNIRNPVDLLVLSACQTARGDERAALGLAGVAVRAGARSTLATLWSVADDSTAQVVSEFYRQLAEEEETKADALREAQLALLRSEEYRHPYYWAPFVMVGNWL